jgi:hypothetical protein
MSQTPDLPRDLRALRLGPDDIRALAELAGRAPSLHNTQPWKIQAHDTCVELYADRNRMLRQVDPSGREMLISCGAALYGLRLGLRKLGYLPETEVLPDPAQPDLVARIRASGSAPVTWQESELLAALPHRHTHRGPFAPGDVSARLMAGLRQDAVAERADLIVVERRGKIRELACLVLVAASEQAADPAVVAELQDWVRQAGTFARDGIPAQARVDEPADGLPADDDWRGPVARGVVASPRLPERDFGLPGTAAPGGHPPVVTAVLTTAADAPDDWIRAGQGLHRLLLHAATRWVFASLQSQPLESSALRAEVRSCLSLAGQPQLLLQFGRATTAQATARRLAADIVTHDCPGGVANSLARCGAGDRLADLSPVDSSAQSSVVTALTSV